MKTLKLLTELFDQEELDQSDFQTSFGPKKEILITISTSIVNHQIGTLKNTYIKSTEVHIINFLGIKIMLYH